METVIGFIVEVSPKQEANLEFRYHNYKKVLKKDEKFIGYFKATEAWGKYAIIEEIVLLYPDSKLFKYGKVAVFEMDDITIKIIAKRGPVSDNRYLPEEFNKYDTWNSIENKQLFR